MRSNAIAWWNLRRGKYERFNDQHLTEKLCEESPPVVLSVRTIRRILRGAGIAAMRRRRPRLHRRRRERKAQAGLMLLWDGSPHAWLEERGPRLCLIGAVDDATSDLLPGAHFVEQECAAGYLSTLKAIVAELGIPWSIYMDQHGSLKRNDGHWTLAEELRGRQDPTQVGMALEALEIEPIYALSPQAKGRVERLWATLQDRLVSELRLAGASTAEQANAVGIVTISGRVVIACELGRYGFLLTARLYGSTPRKARRWHWRTRFALLLEWTKAMATSPRRSRATSRRGSCGLAGAGLGEPSRISLSCQGSRAIGAQRRLRRLARRAAVRGVRLDLSAARLRP